jgi:hypothetical protein
LYVTGDILASLLGAPTAVDLDPDLTQPFSHWYYVALCSVLYKQASRSSSVICRADEQLSSVAHAALLLS